MRDAGGILAYTVLAKSSATAKNLGKYWFIGKMFQTKRIGLKKIY